EGVRVIFRTKSQWFVGPIDVTGKIHAPPNSNQIASATRLDLGTVFNDSDVDAAVTKIRTLLERNGLYRNTITPKVTRHSAHPQVAITSKVDTKKRPRFTRRGVKGDTKIPAAKVAHAAKYKEVLFFPWKLATQSNMQSGLQNVRSTYEKQDRLTASVSLDHAE